MRVHIYVYTSATVIVYSVHTHYNVVYIVGYYVLSVYLRSRVAASITNDETCDSLWGVVMHTALDRIFLLSLSPRYYRARARPQPPRPERFARFVSSDGRRLDTATTSAGT